MTSDQTDVVELIYIVKQCDNLTAYDNFNEDTFQGPTNVTVETWGFLTEHEAMAFYAKGKAMLKFAGGPGLYYSYPVARKLGGRHRTVIDCKNEGEFYYKLACSAKRELCPRCEGDGTMVNPAIDGNGLSHEQMADPDFMESYIRGNYDVPCATCLGMKFIEVPILEDLPHNLLEDYERCLQERQDYEEEKREHQRNLERGIHS
jgi:hypothetical protein